MKSRRCFITSLGFTVAAALGSNDTRAQGVINRGLKSVMDFGATGRGIVNDDNARFLGEARAKSLYWPEGTYIVNQVPSLTISWGPGVVLVGGQQVYLRPDPAPARSIKADVWNPPSGTGTDASAALQSAIDFAQSQGLPVELPPGGDYLVSTGLTFKHGKSSSDNMSYNVHLIGNNATVRPGPSVFALSAVPRCLQADKGTGRGVSQITIHDLTVDGYFSDGSSGGISIGASGFICDSFSWSIVENVEFQNFKSDTTGGAVVLRVEQARHIRFSRVVSRGGTILLTATNTGAFCGDLVFDTCEASGSGQWAPLSLQVSQAVVGELAQLRGIHFHDCDIYGAGTILEAQGATQLGDIWFESCAWDGTGLADQPAVQVVASGTSQVFQLHMTDAYVVNFLGPALVVQQQDSSLINNCRLLAATLNEVAAVGSSTMNSIIFLQGCGQFEIIGTLLTGTRAGSALATNGSSLFKLDGCSNITITGTQAITSSPPPQYGITFGGGANYVFSENTMNVLQALNPYGTTANVLSVNNTEI